MLRYTSGIYARNTLDFFGDDVALAQWNTSYNELLPGQAFVNNGVAGQYIYIYSVNIRSNKYQPCSFALCRLPFASITPTGQATISYLDTSREQPVGQLQPFANFTSPPLYRVDDPVWKPTHQFNPPDGAPLAILNFGDAFAVFLDGTISGTWYGEIWYLPVTEVNLGALHR